MLSNTKFKAQLTWAQTTHLFPGLGSSQISPTRSYLIYHIRDYTESTLFPSSSFANRDLLTNDSILRETAKLYILRSEKSKKKKSKKISSVIFSLFNLSPSLLNFCRFFFSQKVLNSMYYCIWWLIYRWIYTVSVTASMASWLRAAEGMLFLIFLGIFSKWDYLGGSRMWKWVEALLNVCRYLKIIDQLLYICVFVAVGACEISVYTGSVLVYIYIHLRWFCRNVITWYGLASVF